jgi:hypothetical protein
MSLTLPPFGFRRALCWNSMWRNLHRHEVIVSGGEVNWLMDGRSGKRLLAIDLDRGLAEAADKRACTAGRHRLARDWRHSGC